MVLDAGGGQQDEETDEEGWHSDDDEDEWDREDEYAELVRKAAVRHRPARDEALLRFVGGELPRVRCVRGFVCGEGVVWPGALVRVAGAMEGLGWCGWELGDAVTRGEGLRGSIGEVGLLARC